MEDTSQADHSCSHFPQHFKFYIEKLSLPGKNALIQVRLVDGIAALVQTCQEETYQVTYKGMERNEL